ncbi:MAG TPA: hypothetical protein V6C76_02600 [Drouetiella sp.]
MSAFSEANAWSQRGEQLSFAPVTNPQPLIAEVLNMHRLGLTPSSGEGAREAPKQIETSATNPSAAKIMVGMHVEITNGSVSAKSVRLTDNYVNSNPINYTDSGAWDALHKGSLLAAVGVEKFLKARDLGQLSKDISDGFGVSVKRNIGINEKGQLTLKVEFGNKDGTASQEVTMVLPSSWSMPVFLATDKYNFGLHQEFPIKSTSPAFDLVGGISKNPASQNPLSSFELQQLRVELSEKARAFSEWAKSEAPHWVATGFDKDAIAKMVKTTFGDKSSCTFGLNAEHKPSINVVRDDGPYEFELDVNFKADAEKHQSKPPLLLPLIGNGPGNSAGDGSGGTKSPPGSGGSDGSGGTKSPPGGGSDGSVGTKSLAGNGGSDGGMLQIATEKVENFYSSHKTAVTMAGGAAAVVGAFALRSRLTSIAADAFGFLKKKELVIAAFDAGDTAVATEANASKAAGAVKPGAPMQNQASLEGMGSSKSETGFEFVGSALSAEEKAASIRELTKTIDALFPKSSASFDVRRAATAYVAHMRGLEDISLSIPETAQILEAHKPGTIAMLNKIFKLFD